MKLKIWHIIIIFALIIIVIRAEDILNSFLLFISFSQLFLENSKLAVSQFNFSLFDVIVSAFLIILIPVLVFFKRKTKIFSRNINFSFFSIIVLIFFFLFAPLISKTNPNFQKNIGVTKLLPPFSSLYKITLKTKDNFESNTLGKFLKLKSEVIKTSYDESIIFADSVKLAEKLIYFQNDRSKEIEKKDLLYINNEPAISKNIFLLGTDEFGRDIFSRLVYGARISLFIGFGAVAISFILGLFLGFSAGYPGKIIDSILNRFTDMFLAFPIIFLIILIIALFGSSMLTVIIVLGFSGWMSLFKIVRGEVISLKNKDYFTSAKLIGLSKTSLLLKEILPIILAPVIVNLVFQYGNVILAESALSYLGLGVGSNFPSWGNMISAGQGYLTEAWWMIFSPSIALFITLFAAYDVGREINIILNPRLKK